MLKFFGIGKSKDDSKKPTVTPAKSDNKKSAEIDVVQSKEFIEQSCFVEELYKNGAPQQPALMVEEGPINLLFAEAIDRLRIAEKTGKFSSYTNHKFNLAASLLDKLIMSNTDDKLTLHRFSCIIIGAISYAMSTEAEAYGDFATPLNAKQLRHAVDPTYDLLDEKLKRGEIPAENFNRNEALSKIFAVIGRRVQDGQLPRFVSTPLFVEFGVTIDAMLELKAEAEEMLQAGQPAPLAPGRPQFK